VSFASFTQTDVINLEGERTMKKRIAGKMLACVGICLLCIVIFIGCSSTGKEDVQDKDGSVTITTIRGLTGDTIFKNGDTIENNWHTKWAKEKLGIDFKYNWVVTDENDAYKTKLGLMLASNEKMPDVFFTNDKQMIANFSSSGKLLDISDAYEKYASQRVKDIYAKYPEIWNPVKKDGKKFGMPFFSGAEPLSAMWIRQDWLDELHLKAPETIEELEKVMDAFVNQDPDGNGVKDTIGLSLSLKNGFAPYMSDASFLFGAMGAQIPSFWYAAEDGTLKYSSTDPKVEQVLAKLQDWYKKDYIDKESALYDEAKAAESFVQGKSGIIFGSWWLPIWPIGDTVKNNPKAVYKPYMIPAGPDGKRGVTGSNMFAYALLFNKDFKHMDKMFEYIDAMYGYPLADPKSDFKYGFQEGYDYMMVDGKPSYDKSKFPGGFTEASKYTLTQNSIEIPHGFIDVYSKLASKKPPETPSEIRQAGDDPSVIQGGAIISSEIEYGISDKFNGAPTETMVKRGEALHKMELEALVAIVYGKKSSSEFGSFVKDWNANGGQEITKEVNDWFKASQGK
jgi:putative aldouronate transport system substrate-binding protein